MLDSVMNLHSQLDKLINSLDNYYFQLDSNPQRLHEIQERILLLKRIQNRYDLNLNDLLVRKEKYQRIIRDNHNEISIKELENTEQVLREKRDKDNFALTSLRVKIADKFKGLVLNNLKNIVHHRKIIKHQPKPCLSIARL